MKVDSNSTSIVVHYKKVVNGYEISYCNDYCLDSQKCSVSNKGELNTTTGKLTMYSVSFNDEGLYYCLLAMDDDYLINCEINLNVYGKQRSFRVKILK